MGGHLLWDEYIIVWCETFKDGFNERNDRADADAALDFRHGWTNLGKHLMGVYEYVKIMPDYTGIKHPHCINSPHKHKHRPTFRNALDGTDKADRPKSHRFGPKFFPIDDQGIDAGKTAPSTSPTKHTVLSQGTNSAIR